MKMNRLHFVYTSVYRNLLSLFILVGVLSLSKISLAQVTLVLPQDNYVTIDSNLAFSWDELEDFEYFELKIADNDIFENAEIYTVYQSDTLIENVSLGIKFWKVTPFVSGQYLTSSIIRQFNRINLNQIGSISCWLDANALQYSENDAVHTFTDLSSASFNLSQSSNLAMPTYKTDVIGANSAVYFDGAKQLSNSSPISIGTLFCMFQYNNESSALILGLNGPTANPRYYLSISNEVLNTGFSTAFNASQLRRNLSTNLSVPSGSYNLVSGKRAGSTTAVNFSLSPSYGGFPRMSGHLFEMIIYSSILSQMEIDNIESYFRFKYAPPVSLGKNISIEYGFCPVDLDALKDHFVSYLWDDGSINPSRTISDGGEFWVQTTDIFGFVSADTIVITYPNIGNADMDFFCSGESISWDTDLSGVYDFLWNDDQATSTIIINQPGDYFVTATDSQGCSMSSETISIYEDFYPNAVSLISASNFCLGNELSLSSGFAEAETYLWSTSETTPFITPQASGTYFVEATNANGCIGRDTVEVNIVGSAPNVVFDVGPACQGNSVTFTDATLPEGSTITDQQWTFGGSQNPGTAEGEVVQNIFSDIGAYPVELAVTLDNGCTGSTRDTVIVKPLPLVSFNFDEVIPCAGNEVAFESQSGVPGNGDIASYAWSFGNGITDTGIVGSTTFENLGTNTVQLAVTSTDGCVDSLLTQVVVLGSPVADFAADPVCIGQPAVFEENVDVSQSGGVFYNWQFGDGFFSNFPNTSHVYATPGIYNVQLTATGNDFGNPGCVDAITKAVRVYAPPTAQLLLSDACLGHEALLTNASQPHTVSGEEDAIHSQSWSYNQGGTQIAIGTDSLQTFVPASPGIYTIQLDMQTDANCSASATGQVSIFETPEAAFDLSIPVATPPVSATVQNTSGEAENFAWLLNGTVVSTDFSPTLLFPDTGYYVLTLVAGNGQGCNDSVSQAFTLINPQYDLAILDLRQSVVGDRLRLRALLSNNGNTPIGNFDYEVQVGLDVNVRSSAVIELEAGEVQEFLLPADVAYFQPQRAPYACAKVSNPNGAGAAELDLENNDYCVGIEKEQAVFMAPYPNPTSAELNLGFVLPKAGVVKAEIILPDGKVADSFEFQLEAGYSLRRHSVVSLAEGLYFVKYQFGEEQKTMRFVVVAF